MVLLFSQFPIHKRLPRFRIFVIKKLLYVEIKAIFLSLLSLQKDYGIKKYENGIRKKERVRCQNGVFSVCVCGQEQFANSSFCAHTGKKSVAATRQKKTGAIKVSSSPSSCPCLCECGKPLCHCPPLLYPYFGAARLLPARKRDRRRRWVPCCVKRNGAQKGEGEDPFSSSDGQ